MADREFRNIVVDVGQILLTQVENEAEPLITYGDVAGKLPYEFNPRNLDTPLGELSNLCKELDLPLISTIVVNREEMQPGAGYFKYFFPKEKSSRWIDVFIEQYNRVKRCTDWSPLAGELGLK